MPGSPHEPVVTVEIADQRWTVTWSAQHTAPPGKNHGSLGICLAADGVVLVSPDGARWEFPAGRPEHEESLLDTLRREVREEACCEVETAALLGFTTSTCLQGHEQGLVLVRAHWAARATVGSWAPEHEISHRKVVPVAETMSALTIQPGLEPVYERIWGLAQDVFANLDHGGRLQA